MNPLVLFSTFGNHAQGFGHIRRNIWLAQSLKEDFGYEHHFIVNQDANLKKLLEKNQIRFTQISHEGEEQKILENTPARLLIVDRRDTSKGYYGTLPYLTVGIDNYGTDQYYFDYTLNPLPYLEDCEANFKGSKFFIFPDEFWSYQKPRGIRPVRKILVSFGGSDPADLSWVIKEVFERIKEPFEVTFVLGPFYQGSLKALKNPLPAHMKILPPQENLYALMRDSDLVITSFGLTAFEGICLGTPVYLLTPSDYHEKLARQADFPGAGVGSLKKVEWIREKLVRFIASPFYAPVEVPPKGNLNLKMVLKNLLEIEKTVCPVCGKAGAQVMKREGFQNLYSCSLDHTFFRSAGYTAKMAYSSNYFVEDYKKQYGKTYEEDRPNIDRLNASRVQALQSVLPPLDRKRNLLEVGCALGFFLDLAEKTGQFDAEGVEISTFASDYAKHKLGLKVTQKDFLKTSYPYSYYDVLAMWYYLEHNKNLSLLVEKIKEALKIGGILALSTPNARGISARKNRKIYSARIPEDHYYEFSPSGLASYLEKEGFKLLKVRVTGVHPKRWIKLPFNFLNPLLGWVMKKRKMGDTFEAYFERVR